MSSSCFKLGKLIDFAPSAALKQGDEKHLTTIINIYSQIRDLYQPSMTGTEVSRADFTNARPEDEAIDAFYATCTEYWTLLEAQIPELKEVFDGTKKAGYYREAKRNHLLLRPIGQRAFADAVGVLVHVISHLRRRSKHSAKWICGFTKTPGMASFGMRRGK